MQIVTMEQVIYIYESLLTCAYSYLAVNELAPINKSESF